MTELIVVLSTAPNEAKAAEIARALVEEKLAACVNLVQNVRSIYSWQGKISDEAEVLMLMKTRAELFEALRVRLGALHPYECPEIVQLRAEQVNAPYLEWIDATVRAR